MSLLPCRRGALALRRSLLIATFAMPMLASSPPLAHAQNVEAIARSHFELGRAYYDNGNFLKAAEEFEAAYTASQRAALLYNVYLAYRDANDMVNATRALREYLTKEQNIENRAQLEARLGIMEQALTDESQATGTPEASPQPAEATPQPEPSPTAAPAAGPAHDPASEVDASLHAEASLDAHGMDMDILPIALMAGGGAMVVGSVVTGLMAASAQSELEDGCPTRMNCSSDLADTQSRGETLAIVTDVLLFGGIAVAGAGVALFFLGGDDDSSDTTAGLACLPGACHGTVRVAF